MRSCERFNCFLSIWLTVTLSELVRNCCCSRSVKVQRHRGACTNCWHRPTRLDGSLRPAEHHIWSWFTGASSSGRGQVESVACRRRLRVPPAAGLQLDAQSERASSRNAWLGAGSRLEEAAWAETARYADLDWLVVASSSMSTHSIALVHSRLTNVVKLVNK